MSKPRPVEVAERELEDLLVENPESIEEGIRILGRQVKTDSGPLDIIASDADSVLTVLELKDHVDEGQLDQGLRYYDWARSNIEWIARSHPKMIDANQEPRLILIAPTFSDSLKRIAKYVTVSIDLMEYHVIQLPDGRRFAICTSIEIGSPPEPTIVPTRNGHLNRIESERIRQLCLDCIGQLEKMSIEIRPKENFWFSIWYRGKRFMYLGCKKNYFVCSVQRPDGSWTERIRVTDKKDWDELFNKEILSVYTALGGQSNEER